MNPTAQTVNDLGGHLVDLAWPLAWQTTVLIALLFAANLVLRRRTAVAVRYALWLLLPVKLLLPPTFAFPGSLGWWLGALGAPTVHARPSALPSGLATPMATGLSAVVSGPDASLSIAGWMILAWAMGGCSLVVCLAVNWRRVARAVWGASPPPVWLGEVLEETRKAAGLRRAVRLRLIEAPLSPAVAGLFRPVILLPRRLAETLPPGQLRAVLLHELIHIRRLDPWTNCAQTLLQVVYWWHPLVWAANARIRRLREEAVDDAVMLALGEDAECYAPTLIEVARLAFRRPLASLGLVGILESRSALRQRIERVAGFCPRQTGKITLGSCLGILAFGAVALPLSPAPVSISSLGTSRGVETGTGPQTSLLAEAPPNGASPATQSPVSTGANAPGPEIHFVTQKIDFGKVDAGKPVKCTYVFTNIGHQVLEISAVKPACGCTTADNWTRRAEPGQGGTIPVELNTANFHGPVTKTVSVTCNDPVHPTVTLQLQGTVWKAIEINPPLAFLKVPDDSPTNGTAVLRLISHLEAPLTLGAPQSDSPAFGAEIQTDRSGKEFRLIVRATAPLESAALTAKIRVKTSSPMMPELIVPVLANRVKSAGTGGSTAQQR